MAKRQRTNAGNGIGRPDRRADQGKRGLSQKEAARGGIGGRAEEESEERELRQRPAKRAGRTKRAPAQLRADKRGERRGPIQEAARWR
jgi:hypothetical protein